MKKLFLISSSRYQGGGFWAHCIDALGNFMGPAQNERNRVIFIPYAEPDSDYNGYTKTVSVQFEKLGYELIGAHTYSLDSMAMDKKIVAVCIGGGNTWLLQKALMDLGLLNFIRNAVEAGQWKYISASAGTVVSCNSMLTTNDMPPVLPISHKALGLIPFQINPHFVPGAIADKHMGETREERLRQIIVHNPNWQIAGIPEGCWIEVKNNEHILCGIGKAVIFRKDGNNSIWLPGEAFDKEGILQKL